LVPRPDPPHGDVVSCICKKLFEFIFANNSSGQVYFPPEPICIRAEGSTYLEPDLMYVLRESLQETGAQRTSADIVFECLSPVTIVYDYTTKADTYLALGIPELWLIDPFSATIEVRHASKVGERVQWKALKYSRGQNAKSRVLEGFRVSVDELFAEL
jgi:Uma2 family endonuclease